MKNFILSIVFTFIAIMSSGQSKSPNYLLTFDFEPSFIGESQISIQAKEGSCFINILIYKNNTNKAPLVEGNAVLATNKLTALTNFLDTYKFLIKNSIDTVGSHREFIHSDSVLVYDIEAGLDGIAVNGSFTKNDFTKKFAFWSPKEKSENAKLMILLFDLIANAFSDQKVINYIEELQQYFPHKLGLKKLSDTPLTYKLFGSISDSEADEFYNFLDKLPYNGKTIIDLSNFSGMGGMFYDAFEEYHVNKKNIYWLNPTFEALIALHKSGIRPSHIISKQKLIISKKNGQEVFSLKMR